MRVEKTSLLAFFILFATLVNGQNNNTDTVFIKRQISNDEIRIDTMLIEAGVMSQQVLVGTTMLPYTPKMIGLLNNGLSPISLEILESCDGSEKPDFSKYPDFKTIQRDSNVLIIDVAIVANCCYNFLGEAEIHGDTLNLIYTGYGNFCSCSCCYTLRYKFDTSMENYYQLLKHVTVNGVARKTGDIPKE